MNHVIFLITVALISACTVNYKNEKIASLRLQDFIKTSSNLQSANDKSKLLPYLSGEMKDDLEKMTNAQFKEKFVNDKIEIKSIEILDSELLDEENIQILYRLKYVKKEKNEFFIITTEKVSLMTYTDKNWKIKMIYELSTKMDFPEALTIKKKGTVF